MEGRGSEGVEGREAVRVWRDEEAVRVWREEEVVRVW